MRTLRNPVRAMLLAIGLAMGVSAAAVAAPPTDEEIQAVITRVQEASKSGTDRAEIMRAMKTAAEEGLKSISLDEATVAQLQSLSRAGVFMRVPEAKAAIAPRLRELAATNDIDGARAAMMRVANYPDAKDQTPDARHSRQQEVARVYAEALRHPAIGELLKVEREGGEVFQRLGMIDIETLREAKVIDAVEALLEKEMDPSAAASAVSFYDSVADDKNADPAAKERIRTKVLAAVGRAAEKAPKNEDGTDTRLGSYLKSAVTYLDGPYAKGQLIGHTAPAMTFNWTTDEKIKSLADLKGRVVVVDFWATWCGPCIASFPNVRELQRRYEGYPVTILGVTSIQGSHIDHTAKPPERIDTKDDPAKEKELMTGFIKGMDVTWEIAFADQEVFNPDYGVRGIPHVAIIDAAGKVRHNGLHPGGKLADKAAKIDALLKEAGLPCPEPMAEAAEEKNESH